MNRSEVTSPILKVRTFADDMKRAQGSGGDSFDVSKRKKKSIFRNIFSKKSSTEKTEKKYGHHISDKKEILEKQLEEKKAGVQSNTGSTRLATGLKTPEKSVVVHVDTLQEFFNIRNAEAGTPEATIIEDKKKSWSFTEEIGKSIKSKWGDLFRPLHNSGENGVVVVASTVNQKKGGGGAEERHILKKSGDTILQKLRTFADDAEKATGKPVDGGSGETVWKQISEQREETQRVDPEKTVLQKNQASLKRARTTLEQARTSHVREDVIAKDTNAAIAPKAKQILPDETFKKQGPASEATRGDARKRLEQVRFKIRKKGQEMLQSRDIAFELPVFETKEAANIRTYRHDAIEDVEQKKLSVPQIAAAEATRREKNVIPLRKSSSLSLMPTGIVTIGIAVILLIAGTFYIQFIKKPDISVASIPSFISVSDQIPVQLISDRAVFLVSLSEAGNSARPPNGGVTQLYPSVFVDGLETAASTKAVMNVLDLRAPGSFIRTLDESMMMGVYGIARSPFIILKAKQFDLAFVGMLEWENNMSADLAPFFGKPVQRTLDPNARTNDQTGRARFIDNTIRNYDVRILFNELGEERILYSFIDKKTILITTSGEALVTIAETL